MEVYCMTFGVFVLLQKQPLAVAKRKSYQRNEETYIIIDIDAAADDGRGTVLCDR